MTWKRAKRVHHGNELQTRQALLLQSELTPWLLRAGAEDKRTEDGMRSKAST